jgi:hypothetical protein
MHSGRRVALAIVVAAAVVVAAAAARSAPGKRFAPLRQMEATLSLNWAGYIVQAPDGADPLTFTDVVGTWVQPKLSCTKGRAASSGFWVGLGGARDDSDTLEQTGTAATCTSSGKATYYAWYEVVPAPPTRVNLTIAPGDTILGAVAYIDGHTVLELKNLTRGTAVTRRMSADAPDLSSAEWIAEAPSLCSSLNNSCRIDRLANFRRILFMQAAVTGAEHTGTINDPAWEATPITLAPNASLVAADPLAAGAVPSALTEDGRSFSVTWARNVAAP